MAVFPSVIESEHDKMYLYFRKGRFGKKKLGIS